MRGQTVVDLPRFPPGAVVGDAATRTLLALMAHPFDTLDQLATRLNARPFGARWTAERVEAQLEVLGGAGLVAVAR